MWVAMRDRKRFPSLTASAHDGINIIAIKVLTSVQ